MTNDYAPYTDRLRGETPPTQRHAGQRVLATRTGHRSRPASSAAGPIIIAVISLIMVVLVAYGVTEYNRIKVSPSQVRTLALATVRQIPGYDLKASYYEQLAEQSHPRAWRIVYEENQENMSPERRQQLYNRQLLRRMAEIAINDGQDQIANACRSVNGE